MDRNNNSGQPSSFSKLLASSASLNKLSKQADDLAKMDRRVREMLEPNIQAHCRVANLRDGILVLSTTSPAYGHLLRFKTVDILSALRAEPGFEGLKSIKTRVIPSQDVTLSPTPKAPQNISGYSFSNQIRKLLQCTADNIVSAKLKSALLRLTRHTRHTNR